MMNERRRNKLRDCPLSASSLSSRVDFFTQSFYMRILRKNLLMWACRCKGWPTLPYDIKVCTKCRTKKPTQAKIKSRRQRANMV